MPSNRAGGKLRIRAFAAAIRICLASLYAALALLPGGYALAAEPSCPAGPRQHLELPATRVALMQRRPITIVAFGSSSTEGAGASAPDRTYPARLEAMLRAHWPGVAVTVLNRGIGGQTIDAMLERLDAGVLAAGPILVIWQVGANDALRGMDPVRFGSLLDRGVPRIAASGSDVILMDSQIAPRMPRTDHQSIYGAIIAHEAEVRYVSLFSRTALMQAWQAANPSMNDMIGPDGLHHTDRGYTCIAEALDQAIIDAVAKPAIVVSAYKK